MALASSACVAMSSIFFAASVEAADCSRRAPSAQGSVDVADQFGDTLSHLTQAGDRIACLAGEGDAAVDQFDATPDAGHDFTCRTLDGTDHLRDFSRRMRGPLRELAHFVGDDGKTAPGFTGTGGLDRGIECEQIGLVGNILDHRDDVRDFFAVVLQLRDLVGCRAYDVGNLADLLNQLFDRRMAFSSLGIGILRNTRRFAGVVSNDVDRNGQLLDIGSDRRCGGALDRG